MPIADKSRRWLQIYRRMEEANYLINTVNINNVTPFTYGDGLTYYEVLSKLREVISDIVDYVNEFGEEEKRLVAEFNEKVKEFVASNRDVFETQQTSFKNALKELDKQTDAFLKSLLVEKFEKHPSGKFFTTTAKDGSQIAVASSQGMQDVLDELTTVRSSVSSNKANADRRLNDLESNSIVNRVSKYPHTLIIGSSNAILTGHANGTWDESCCHRLR